MRYSRPWLPMERSSILNTLSCHPLYTHTHNVRTTMRSAICTRLHSPVSFYTNAPSNPMQTPYPNPTPNPIPPATSALPSHIAQPLLTPALQLTFPSIRHASAHGSVTGPSPSSLSSAFAVCFYYCSSESKGLSQLSLRVSILELEFGVLASLRECCQRSI